MKITDIGANGQTGRLLPQCLIDAGLIAMLVAMIGSFGRAADLPTRKHAFAVIAHRGAHQQHHENTLEAFEAAIEAGADYIEMDVRASRDGRYLLMHDSTVDRMTDGSGSVAGLAWTELEALQVRDPSLANVPPSRIPTLEEALALCHHRIHIYLDFKSGDRAEVARLIRSADMSSQVLVYDDVSQIAVWREIAPELPLIVSLPESARASPSGLAAFLKDNPCEVLDGKWSGWTAEIVRKAESLGARVWPDIQNPNENPEYWQKVLAPGFSGVQTDHPVELIRWLKARNGDVREAGSVDRSDNPAR